jgi:hypothetical protein
MDFYFLRKNELNFLKKMKISCENEVPKLTLKIIFYLNQQNYLLYTTIIYRHIYSILTTTYYIFFHFTCFVVRARTCSTLCMYLACVEHTHYTKTRGERRNRVVCASTPYLRSEDALVIVQSRMV